MLWKGAEIGALENEEKQKMQYLICFITCFSLAAKTWFKRPSSLLSVIQYI